MTALAIDTMYDLLSLLSAKMTYHTSLGKDAVLAQNQSFLAIVLIVPRLPY